MSRGGSATGGVGATVWHAVRANLVPGLILWATLGLFLLAYAISPTVQHGMARWAQAKTDIGPWFAFFSYVVFAVVVPEGLGALLRRQWPSGRQWADMAYASLIFGAIGWAVDLLYRYQILWFGTGRDLLTLSSKVVVDQMLAGPVLLWMSTVLLLWRDAGFVPGFWRVLGQRAFWAGRFLPVLVANWCIWYPTNFALYALPPPLQFPVVSMVMSFWILVFQLLRKG